VRIFLEAAARLNGLQIDKTERCLPCLLTAHLVAATEPDGEISLTERRAIPKPMPLLAPVMSAFDFVVVKLSVEWRSVLLTSRAQYRY